MAIVTFIIDVDENSNARVTRVPDRRSLRTLTAGADRVRFKVSGDPGQKKKSAVKLTSSPFTEFRSGKILSTRRVQGPFLCEKIGDHDFECGSMVGGVFSRWGGTAGGDIPVC
jgi:hypothetical protein